jgi:hypothetical protein
MFKKLKALLVKQVTDDFKEWQDPQAEEIPMSCPEFTIESIDRELYARLLAECIAAGAKFDGNKASISGCGFIWNYDVAAQVLHLTCTEKPFYAGCQAVESRIRELIEKAKASI